MCTVQYNYNVNYNTKLTLLFLNKNITLFLKIIFYKCNYTNIITFIKYYLFSQ